MVFDPQFYRYDPDKLEDCNSYHRLLQAIKKGMKNADNGPWLWLGAGLSIAAGCPTATRLAEMMCEEIFHTQIMHPPHPRTPKWQPLDTMTTIALIPQLSPCKYHKNPTYF